MLMSFLARNRQQKLRMNAPFYFPSAVRGVSLSLVWSVSPRKENMEEVSTTTGFSDIPPLIAHPR